MNGMGYVEVFSRDPGREIICFDSFGVRTQGRDRQTAIRTYGELQAIILVYTVASRP